MANESFFLRSRLFCEKVLSEQATWFNDDLAARNAAHRQGLVVVRVKADNPNLGKGGEYCVGSKQDIACLLELGVADEVLALPLIVSCANCQRHDRYEDISGLPNRKTDRSHIHQSSDPELSDEWIECESCGHFTHFAAHAPASIATVTGDRAYLQALADGPADFSSPSAFERLETMFARYEDDQEMTELLNRAAKTFGESTEKGCNTLLEDMAAREAARAIPLQPITVIAT